MGSLACGDCPLGYNTNGIGKAKCEVAAAGYFVVVPKPSSKSSSSASSSSSSSGTDTTVTASCPVNAVCSGGFQMPRPGKGWWVDRRRSWNAKHVYECPRDTCTGASNDDEENSNQETTAIATPTAAATQRRRLLTSTTTSSISSTSSSSSCWALDSYSTTSTSSTCNEDDASLLCRTGSSGPLCGSCDNGFTFNGPLAQCVPCGTAGSLLAPIAVSALVLLAVVVLLTRRCSSSSSSSCSTSTATGTARRRFFPCGAFSSSSSSSSSWLPWLLFLRHADTGMLKVNRQRNDQDHTVMQVQFLPVFFFLYFPSP